MAKVCMCLFGCPCTRMHASLQVGVSGDRGLRNMGFTLWFRVLQRQDSSSDNLLHEEGILCKRIKTFDPKMSPVK